MTKNYDNSDAFTSNKKKFHTYRNGNVETQIIKIIIHLRLIIMMTVNVQL